MGKAAPGQGGHRWRWCRYPCRGIKADLTSDNWDEDTLHEGEQANHDVLQEPCWINLLVAFETLGLWKGSAWSAIYEDRPGGASVVASETEAPMH